MSLKGQKLWIQAKKIIPGGTQLLSKQSEMFLPDQWPAYFKKAKGVEVWDLDGKKYLDMASMGIGSCILGYADSDVNKAVIKAINSGSMCTLNSPEEVELAKMLIKLHPWADMVRYARTGGEAMAIAVRIARAYSGKDKIAFCGYHGWQDWYLASNLADDKNLDGHLIRGLQPEGVPRGLIATALPFNYNKIDELHKIFSEHKDVGAIVMEPMRYREPESNFLLEVKRIAKKNKAVLIFDEITSGWRNNLGGVHLKYKVNPDVAVFAKAISNGFPMAAIIGRKKIMKAAQDSFISSTYWTERIGPTAALATIKKLKNKRAHAHIYKVGKKLIDGLKMMAKECGIKLQVSGSPSCVHLSFDYGKMSLPVMTLFTQEMLRRNILAGVGIYITYSLQEKHVKRYLKNARAVFVFLKKTIQNKRVFKLLKGPVVHSGFKRLT